MTGHKKETMHQSVNPEAVNSKVADSKRLESMDQYLTFFMGGEEFGINILSVQEIRGWEPITEIPNSPRQVLGVMNLRGTVSPIIDLRYCFGIRELSYTEQTVVIIVSVPVKSDKKPKVVGIVVDAVSDVYNFAASDIQASPELAQTHQAQYVRGLASTEEKMVIILDLTAKLIEEIEPAHASRHILASH